MISNSSPPIALRIYATEHEIQKEPYNTSTNERYCKNASHHIAVRATAR
jgi:hypothetical protein